jgi:hypothetical protein
MKLFSAVMAARERLNRKEEFAAFSRNMLKQSRPAK